MGEMLMVAIGVGLAVNLFFSELFGISVGGMVAAGYFAINLNSPLDIIITMLASILTAWIVRLLSKVILIYGRRQFAFMVLIGFLIGGSMKEMCNYIYPYMADMIFSIGFNQGQFLCNLNCIGFIIPGLIAAWIERQGVFVTLCTLIIGAVIVRLIMIVAIGGKIDDLTGAMISSKRVPSIVERLKDGSDSVASKDLDSGIRENQGRNNSGVCTTRDREYFQSLDSAGSRGCFSCYHIEDICPTGGVTKTQ